jgi:very-short-patch-repair endonuclease
VSYVAPTFRTMAAREKRFKELVRLLRSQHGLATTGQARVLGIKEDALGRHVKAGRLTREHRRIYGLPGYPDTFRRRVMAACLCVGPPCAATGRTAARLHCLDGFARTPALEIAIPAKRCVTAAGFSIRRTDHLPAGHRCYVDRIPATTVERTLLEVAGRVSDEVLEIAVDSALRQRLTTSDRLFSLLEDMAGRGRRGVAAFRRVLKSRSNWTPTDSSLETKTLRVIRSGGLPEPVIQKPLGSNGELIGRVDLYYRPERLVIEVDSYKYHSSRLAWQHDLTRQNRLMQEELRVLRFTEDDVDRRPSYVIATIRAFLEE